MRYFFPLLECCASYSKSSSHRGFPKKLLCACYFAFTFTGEEEEDDELLYSSTHPLCLQIHSDHPKNEFWRGKSICLSLLLRSKSKSRCFLNKNMCSCFKDITHDKKDLYSTYRVIENQKDKLWLSYSCIGKQFGTFYNIS